MKIFEIGKTYSMRSICDHDCVWHNEFNRYVETFSHAIGIPEEDFISYLEEKGLYKNNVNQKSE